jgi:hypothetical protein
VIILDSRIPVVQTSTLTHFRGVRYDITTRLFNSSPYFAAYLLRFHRRCQSRSLRVPSCTMLFSGQSTPLPTHSQPDGSQECPLNPHHRLVRQTRLYHILHQVVPIQAHGCTIFMGGHSMNRSLYLGMMSTTGFQSPPNTALNCQNPLNVVLNPSPQIPILHTNREQQQLIG